MVYHEPRFENPVRTSALARHSTCDGMFRVDACTGMLADNRIVCLAVEEHVTCLTQFLTNGTRRVHVWDGESRSTCSRVVDGAVLMGRGRLYVTGSRSVVGEYRRGFEVEIQSNGIRAPRIREAAEIMKLKTPRPASTRILNRAKITEK